MQTHGVVLVSVANLYSRPSTTVDLVTQAILGTNLLIEQAQPDWYHVLMPDRYRGWIQAHQVKEVGPGEGLPYPASSTVVEIKNLLAFLYRAPNATTQAPALQVTIGARLELVQERDERWLQVALPDGTTYWIQRGDVALAGANGARPRQVGAREPRPQDVIDTAKRFLGLPYLWGGNTPLGIDCSGFVQLVYGLNGVSLLRDADIQYTQPGLSPVERGDLQAGDLLFFGENGISHVGLYIGRANFIHATTHVQPIVQISALDEPHWTGLYRGARRP